MKKTFTRLSSTLMRTLAVLMLFVMGSTAWGETVTYTWSYSSSVFTVSSSGTTPQGSSASLTSTYSSTNQLIGGKTQTLTLTGFDECTITGVSINMKRSSSTSAKANISISANGNQIGSVNGLTLTTSQADYPITIEPTKISSSNNVVITVSAAANSVYVYNYVITYTGAGKTALGAATNLSSSNVTSSSADLSWDAVSNANSYKVKIGSTEFDANTNSYTATGLEENTEYEWTVKALAGSSDTYSDGEYSSASSFTTGDFVPTAGTYNIVPNNTFFNCTAFTSKPSGFTTATGTKKGITIVYTAASSAYINESQCRTYSGTKLDFTAPTGYVLTKILFTAEGSNWAGSHTASVGSMTDSKTWEGSASTVTITFGGTCRCTNIAVTYIADKALQSVAVSGSPTKTAYLAGENFDPAGLTVTGTYVDNSQETITEGITWSTPDALTAGQTSVSITATVNGVTSPSYIVTGLTVKSLNSIAVSGTPAEFWKGDTFNHTGMTVTASWSNGDNEDVTAEATFSTPDMTTAGQKEVTVSYGGKQTSYNIEVKTIENTQVTAYTVAQARAKIDAGKDLNTEVYVKGKVSEIVTAWSSQYNNITYNISDDGTTSADQLQLFRCATNGAVVSDQVIAHGKLVKFNDTYELGAGNTIVEKISRTTSSIAISGTPTKTTYKLGEAFNPAGLIVTATYSDNTIADVTASVTWTKDPTTFTTVGTSVAISAKATFEGKEATYNGTVTVNKKTAAIAIADIVLEVSDEVQISATTTPSDADLTYSITSGSDKITLTEGKITGVAVGSATVKASFAGNEEYDAAEKSFNVTVNAYVPKVKFDLSKDETTSASEDQLQWVNLNVTMTVDKENATTDANNYYPGTANQSYSSTRFYKNSKLSFAPAGGITISSIVVTATTDGYATALKNSTWTNATASVATKVVTITPTSGTSVVSAVLGATSGASEVVVYYSGTATVGLTSSENLQGWKSFVSAGANFQVDANTSIYVATATGADNVTLKKVPGNIVKKGSAVLLKTEANDYQISLTATTDEAETSHLWSDNLLSVSAANASGYMLAYSAADGLGFYKTNSIPAGKVYLPSTNGASTLHIVIDDEEAGSANGIATVEAEQESENIFDLNGMKVSQKKGLQILDGKVIMVK